MKKRGAAKKAKKRSLEIYDLEKQLEMMLTRVKVLESVILDEVEWGFDPKPEYDRRKEFIYKKFVE